MTAMRTTIRLIVIGLAAVLGSLLGLFVAAYFLMTLGVRLYGNQDYFSPFYHDAGTVMSELIGGVIFFCAGILGFAIPLIIAVRRKKTCPSK